MKKVSKSELKAKMFEHFRELEAKGGSLIVTDYGKPVLKIVPVKEEQSVAELFSAVRGKVKIDRDAALESTVEEWGSE